MQEGRWEGHCKGHLWASQKERLHQGAESTGTLISDF